MCFNILLYEVAWVPIDFFLGLPSIYSSFLKRYHFESVFGGVFLEHKGGFLVVFTGCGAICEINQAMRSILKFHQVLVVPLSSLVCV